MEEYGIWHCLIDSYANLPDIAFWVYDLVTIISLKLAFEVLFTVRMG